MHAKKENVSTERIKLLIEVMSHFLFHLILFFDFNIVVNWLNLFSYSFQTAPFLKAQTPRPGGRGAHPDWPERKRPSYLRERRLGSHLSRLPGYVLGDVNRAPRAEKRNEPQSRQNFLFRRRQDRVTAWRPRLGPGHHHERCCWGRWRLKEKEEGKKGKGLRLWPLRPKRKRRCCPCADTKVTRAIS